MKFARRSTQMQQQQPPVSAPGKLERSASATTAVADVTPIDNQELAAAVAPQHRKTRSMVENWFKTFFATSKTSSSQRRRERRRRASTGSMFERSDSTAPAAGLPNTPPSRLKRASSLFSLRTQDKENQQSHASPSGTDTQWLKPVASFADAFERIGELERLALVPSVLIAASDNQNDCTTADSPIEPAQMLLATYVVPPVEMPSAYRIQDRRGGMIVAGRTVLFTNAAFKRRLRNLSQLREIPEHDVAPQLDAQLDAYLYGLQHFGAVGGCYEHSPEPLSQWI